ncbi:hypothetical protein M413DRAFT_7609 [Hebeloma cylindrosporum]|uniref:G-alpha-domain-containing protein n=1 Tax=Hebeloma cylindrosporum TaxID=76867 RepID=A0A0C2YAQ0_HEBCY|nr:hypothetical protein M413DRAFT_7609 [Hebeloma cylindrosporum h7]
MPVATDSSRTQWPPVSIRDNETGEESKQRLHDAAEAKRISDEIDRQLDHERLQRSKVVGVKILLLGQAESGKSTVLKNFQLLFAPKAFELEAEVWRPVIHLNLVRSVNFIISFLTRNQQGKQGGRDSIGSNHQRKASAAGAAVSPEIRKLFTRLAPLRQVEENLIAIISGRSTSKSSDGSQSQSQYNPSKVELSVRSGSGWKQALSLVRESVESSESSTRSIDHESRRILAALGDDIANLWKDDHVQQSLKEAEIALQEQPGFFLDQAARVAQEDYRPSPDDVLKARVTTIGPEEHIIIPESGSQKAKQWTIYDVGGSRGQRAAWAQFFDDVHIIIFLAPMSGFNQVLAEDESVNRLTDSLRLWQLICSNKILANVEFVLFLNKLDILGAKLKSGIQFSSFVTSYKDQPNETKPVARYLLDVFASLHQQHSPKRRRLYPYLTCAVDTKATSSVIFRIQEVILVKLLGETHAL